MAEISHHLRSLKASITGHVEEGIACFRGIPYATVEKRWTHSQTKHSLEADSPFDATKYGHRCSQGDGPVLVTGGVLDPTPGDDEFKGLNLNVVTPQEALGTKSALPVMVWIHGGAFNYGANSLARYRGVQLSLRAKAQGHPIVIVQIQYRLGPLGFAACNDFKSEQHSTPTASDPNSILGNFGLVDQIHALEWVRDHIQDFGGDPNNVTAFGVSAGSASIHFHILTGSPLFDRAILMSGSGPTLGPLPFSLYEQAWQNSLERHGGFKDLKTPAERLEKARALTPKELLENYSGAPFGPMADGILFPLEWKYNEKQTLTRCKEIIIGDTKVEAIIMDNLIKSIPIPNLIKIVEDTIPDSAGFLEAFAITPDMSPTAYLDSMRCALSVGMFQYPNVIVSQNFPGKVYQYHFDEPSPYPGPTQGIPYHGQCALFTHLNVTEGCPPDALKTSENMARVWTAFASGERDEPWEEYRVAERFMRLGPKGGMTMQKWETDDSREYKWMPWVQENYESLCKITRELTVKP